MPLQGTFDVLDFPEVLRLVATHAMTGRLHLRSRSFGANLFVDDGQLVGADQSEHQAAATTGDVRGRVEEICFEMLDAERGSFEFHPGRPVDLPGVEPIDVDEVLAEAATRLDDWYALQEIIPSLDVQPRLVDALSATEVTLDRERWRVLTAIDGRRSLRAIARLLNLSDYDVCRISRGLLQAGVIELDATSVATASRELGTVESLALDQKEGVTVLRRTGKRRSGNDDQARGDKEGGAPTPGPSGPAAASGPTAGPSGPGAVSGPGAASGATPEGTGPGSPDDSPEAGTSPEESRTPPATDGAAGPAKDQPKRARHTVRIRPHLPRTAGGT